MSRIDTLLCRLQDIKFESMQQDVVAATIRNEILQKKPLPNSYIMNFMKVFMSKIEEFGGEISEVTFEAYGDILTKPVSEITYKHYDVKGVSISLQENNTLIAEGTTGLKTWQASQRMAEYLVDDCSLLKDKHVLELGAGLGLLGLTVCSLCNCGSYLLSDHHSSVLHKLQRNIAENSNNLLCIPSVVDIDWEEVSQNGFTNSLKEKIQCVDVVLAADVVYDVKIIQPLVQTLLLIIEIMKEEGKIFVASTIRNEATYESFLKELDKHGLVSNEITKHHLNYLFMIRQPT
ncbi:FAM86A [Bugula neritina]|uniref:FAM86A n=1 Tax=Bugula neritina TaxID=10212 RepID=A0A7J7KR74_BUGNE|nr:FAM86A [Bugula neritina]